MGLIFKDSNGKGRRKVQGQIVDGKPFGPGSQCHWFVVSENAEDRKEGKLAKRKGFILESRGKKWLCRRYKDGKDYLVDKGDVKPGLG